MIVTQYEGVAEIEALKVRRQQQRSSQTAGATTRRTEAWSSAHEREIRAEMERRLAARQATPPRS